MQIFSFLHFYKMQKRSEKVNDEGLVFAAETG